MRRTLVWLGLALDMAALASCGPQRPPNNAPTRPCEIISEAAYNAAREAGAARGAARLHANGSVSLDNGPGVRRCASGPAALRPCRRPADYVIEYTKADGEKFFVRVPANTDYRFNVHAAPNTCQIILPLTLP